jgi:hypothetical protein
MPNRSVRPTVITPPSHVRLLCFCACTSALRAGDHGERSERITTY